MGGQPVELQGLGVGRGSALAPLVQMYPAPVIPDDEPVLPPEEAFSVVESALQAVAADLRTHATAAEPTLSAILTATAAIATDPALLKDVQWRLETGRGPASALDGAVAHFAQLLTDAGGITAERVTDLRSVRDRAVARLLGQPDPGVPRLTTPCVVAAVDLSPDQVAALDLSLVRALLMAEGGPTGHSALVASQLGLPCVVQVRGISQVAPGTMVGVDATTGAVVLNPNANQRAHLEHRREIESRLTADQVPGSTSDGHPVHLMATIGSVEDARRGAAVANEGVGLLRTELLFLGRQLAPSVAEQATHYRKVLDQFPGQVVTVRTWDAGVDKPLPFAEGSGAENPSLGLRGFRGVRRWPHLLETQLEALALAYEQHREDTREPAQLQVMAPMITTVGETRQFVSLARSYGLQRIGVTIEVPAAALRAGQIVSEVDFVAIGTNDLAQYTMAADRRLGDLADLLSPWQPAVLELVASSTREARRNHTPVTVCGESASDPLMALVLTGFGVRALSMPPGAMPAVRYLLRRVSLAQCQTAAQATLTATDAASARAAVLELITPEDRTVLELQ